MRSYSSRLRVGIGVTLAALFIAAALPVHAGTTMKDRTLYERLGKRKAIATVVNDFVTRISSDTRVNGFFAATTADPARLTKFKTNMVDQLCQASGGPFKYTGKDMKTAHHGMHITQANFDAVVEDLTASLEKFKVSKTDEAQLLKVLEPMRNDIAVSGDN